MTASLLKSPGLFSVFWPFSTMLWSGWSSSVLHPPIPLILHSYCTKSTNLDWYNHHLHVPYVFLITRQGPDTYFSFHFFFQFYSVISRYSKVDNFASSLFWLISISSGFLAEITSSVLSLLLLLLLYSFKDFHISVN